MVFIIVIIIVVWCMERTLSGLLVFPLNENQGHIGVGNGGHLSTRCFLPQLSAKIGAIGHELICPIELEDHSQISFELKYLLT